MLARVRVDGLATPPSPFFEAWNKRGQPANVLGSIALISHNIILNGLHIFFSASSQHGCVIQHILLVSHRAMSRLNVLLALGLVIRAVVANTDDIEYAPSWVKNPDGRGTWTIVYSAALTLFLFAYSMGPITTFRLDTRQYGMRFGDLSPGDLKAWWHQRLPCSSRLSN